MTRAGWQIVGLFLLMALSLCACGRQSPGSTPVSGSAGGAEGESAERIVVLSPAAALMLKDLGLAGRIVGKHDYDLALDGGIPAVGHQEAIDYERLIAVEPTHVVIEWGSRPLPPRLVELAAGHDWMLIKVGLLTLDDIARTIDDLAITFGAVSLDTSSPDPPSGIPEDIGSFTASFRFSDPGRRFDIELPSATLARAWSVRGDGFGSVGPVLLLASSAPPGALGPGSFHHQILLRIGGDSVFADGEGSPWIELDAEDVLRLDPAAIVLIAPRATGGAAGKEAEPLGAEQIRGRLGRIGSLDIRAVRDGRLAVIDDPFSLLPSTSMAGFADRLAEILDIWAAESASKVP